MLTFKRYTLKINYGFINPGHFNKNIRTVSKQKHKRTETVIRFLVQFDFYGLHLFFVHIKYILNTTKWNSVITFEGALGKHI